MNVSHVSYARSASLANIDIPCHSDPDNSDTGLLRELFTFLFAQRYISQNGSSPFSREKRHDHFFVFLVCSFLHQVTGRSFEDLVTAFFESDALMNDALMLLSDDAIRQTGFALQGRIRESGSKMREEMETLLLLIDWRTGRLNPECADKINPDYWMRFQKGLLTEGETKEWLIRDSSRLFDKYRNGDGWVIEQDDNFCTFSIVEKWAENSGYPVLRLTDYSGMCLADGAVVFQEPCNSPHIRTMLEKDTIYLIPDNIRLNAILFSRIEELEISKTAGMFSCEYRRREIEEWKTHIAIRHEVGHLKSLKLLHKWSRDDDPAVPGFYSNIFYELWADAYVLSGISRTSNPDLYRFFLFLTALKSGLVDDGRFNESSILNYNHIYLLKVLLEGGSSEGIYSYLLGIRETFIRMEKNGLSFSTQHKFMRAITKQTVKDVYRLLKKVDV